MAASMLTHSMSAAGLPCARTSGLRCLSISAPRSRRKDVQPRQRKEPMEIPGLERITYADRCYYVPWLARPQFPRFEMNWNPQYYRCPPAQEMALYKEQPSYVFNPKCRLLGGVKQALWLTKSKLIEGLPQRILKLCEDPAYTFPNHEELVHNAISSACLWSTTEEIREREEYCPKLLESLLHLCRTQHCTYPSLSQRTFVENWKLATSWHKDSTIYHIRGTNGSLICAKTPLEPLASSSEIQATEPHVLESLHPLSPAIDLQEVNVYEEKNDIGFKDGFPYPNLHTVYLTEPCSTRAKFSPDQLRAKMIMIAFGGAVAKARILFGEDVKTLPQPVVVQSVGTDGQLFHFMVLQLNTLDFQSNDGIKNLVWMDGDQALYDTVACKPKIKRKVVLIPAGIAGFKPETFVKFWAMYLNGAV
ncbi:39S ribosomal protein L37, mitochondrial [Hyla sarda]|uniref:39S ribosomal protein L37, mitochondrial n=1 Tax=Hyla sarda TaxID=327740 RepID=UPI0024C3077A|nr:39S ribosomal protein L37, mitochondrial [Hyla sarda]